MAEGPYSLEDRVTRQEMVSLQTAKDVTEIKLDIALMRNKLNGRPSWGVVTAMMFMQAMIGVLLSALIYTLATH